MKTISDVDTLIDCLGGVTKSSRIFGEKVNVIGNWKLRKKLPANKFLLHQKILLEHGISASPKLWFGASKSVRRRRAAS